MLPEAELLLSTGPGKNTEIGQDIEDCLPLRRQRKGVRGLQVLVMSVRGLDELRVGLSHVLVGLAANDPSTSAEIQARRTIAEGE